MGLVETFYVLSSVFYTIAMIGTIITGILLLGDVFLNVNFIGKVVVFLGRIFLVIWILNIGLYTFIMINDKPQDTKKTSMINYNVVDYTSTNNLLL